jgi:arylsulfatase A-like enzyme
MLTEILSRNGYTTGGFVNIRVLEGHIGFDRGFDTYIFKGVRSAEETNSDVTDWLDQLPHGRFYLWVHYFEPHFTYEPPVPYNTMFSSEATTFDDYNKWEYNHRLSLMKELVENSTFVKADFERAYDLYDGEIRYTDYHIGNLLRYLKQTGHYDSSVIIVVGDHGESFDHGLYFFHGFHLYNSNLHVPLIIKLPNGESKGTLVDNIVESIDIAPTILSIIGLQTPDEYNGDSLLKIREGNFEKAVAFAQQPRCHPINVRCYPIGRESAPHTVFDHEWKLIANPYNGTIVWELYNRIVDPNESVNIFYPSHPFYISHADRIVSTLGELPSPEESENLQSTNMGRLHRAGLI